VAPSVQHRKVWLTPLPCSNAAKTRKPLKFGGVPDRSQPLVGRHIVRTSGEDIAAEQVFFPIVDTCLSREDIVGLVYSYRISLLENFTGDTKTL